MNKIVFFFLAIMSCVGKRAPENLLLNNETNFFKFLDLINNIEKLEYDEFRRILLTIDPHLEKSKTPKLIEKHYNWYKTKIAQYVLKLK